MNKVFQFLTVVVLAGATLESLARDRVYIYGGATSRRDTAYCPRGYRIERCDFNRVTCDEEREGRDYCSADSRSHRPCTFTGVCVAEWEREPRRTVVYAGRAGGYDTANCPAGFEVEQCRFDYNSCDSFSENRYSCTADSHRNRFCRIEAHCIEQRRHGSWGRGDWNGDGRRWGWGGWRGDHY